MTAKLVEPIDEDAFSNPANRESFFGKDKSDSIRDDYEVARELRAVGQPGKSCDVNLFLGFFFDGTRNNYDLSSKRKDETYSNVARLYDAYPGQSVPGVPADPDSQWTTDPANYEHFFKIYVPGVGSPFQQVKDSGEGKDARYGAAFASYGEVRIIWALVQALNCVHRYLTKGGKGPGLFSGEEILDFASEFRLGWRNLLANPKEYPSDNDTMTNHALLQRMLRKLHAAIKPHMIDPATGQCSQVDPGRVQHIYASAFGFSRGSAEARVFTNWFLKLCELDAEVSGQSGGRTLGSFPVTFDFLGIFDTVASVGIAASSLFADGHGAWADSDHSMRIPEDVPCLHIVAAHEVRRSFPSDSAHVGNKLPAQTNEWVCPGAHSDIGGGYLPKEQGKGTDAMGSDMLSRIPLALMYRQARLAGVPVKLELARPLVQQRFKIEPGAIRDFNAYLVQCKVKEGLLRDIMAEQRKFFILWRKSWAGRILEMPSVQRAPKEDRADLRSADEGFQIEVRDFEAWLRQKKRTVSMGPRGGTRQVDNIPGIDSERLGEWQRIEAYWHESTPDLAVCKLFEDRVHDSHAWFKLLGTEAADFEKEMKKLVQKKAEMEQVNKDFRRAGTRLLTREQEQWVDLYLTQGEYAPEFTEGREWYKWGAGYLRYRRVYAGADNIRLTRIERPVKNAEPEMSTA